MRRFPIWFFSALIFAGCPTSSEPEPEPTPEPEPGVGVDPTVRAQPGEVRGGVLPEDPDDFAAAAWAGIAAEARPGDLVLYNDRVRFAVRTQPGHGYIGVAGALIDADIVRPEGQLGRDCMEEAFIAFGIGRLAGADSVELVADGSDGEPAIVRVTGRDVPWTFSQGVAESPTALLPDLGLAIVTDYILAPDTWSLLVRSTFTNTGDEEVRINPLDGMIASLENMASYGYGEGLDTGALDDLDAIGQVGRNGEATLLLHAAEGTVGRAAAGDLLSSTGVELLGHGWTDLAPGAELVLERYRSVGPDPATLEAARMEALGTTLGVLTGQVTSDGSPVAGARVHLIRDGLFEGFAVTDADGRYRHAVPPGTYTAIPTAWLRDERVDLPAGAGHFGPFAHPSVNARQLAALAGDSTPPPVPSPVAGPWAEGTEVTVAEGEQSLDLTLPSAATLSLTITSEGEPLAAFIEVHHADGAPTPPFSGELLEGLGVEPRSRAARVWSPDGEVDVVLPLGEYTVAVYGSHRHERASATVDLDATGEALTLDLDRVIDRDGWLAMDSHLHGAPSNDGELPMEDRLVTCAAAGVDLPVTTDHDKMAPYGPLVEPLGLADRLRVVDGVEVSPVLRGHFNLFPAPSLGPETPNGGAPAWWEPFDDTDALFERIRERAPEGLLQLNHARESSGMLDASDYDPSTGSTQRPDFFSWSFDAVEIMNAGNTGDRELLKVDWYSWLDQGRIRLPLGVSDAHGRTGCGYGHTDVFLDTTDPGSVTDAALTEALRAGHVVVSGGLTLRVDANGALPGDTVTGSFAADVVVSAPSWAVPTEVRLVRNGDTVESVDLTGVTPTDGVWWSGSFADTPDDDAWYVVEVVGSQGLGGMWGGSPPYALTNAVFVDVAGDGWTAPGLDP